MSTHRHQTDLPQLEEPVRASPKDTNSRRKTKLAELDEEEKEELRTLKADHRDNMKLPHLHVQMHNHLRRLGVSQAENCSN